MSQAEVATFFQSEDTSMTKEEIKSLVYEQVTPEKLHTFLNELIKNGFVEIHAEANPLSDEGPLVSIISCASQEFEDDKIDFGITLANLLGSDA